MVTVPFKHSNSIVIAAPAEKIFDYVTNPKSWPEWLPSSHEIDCENRPMGFGDTFHEHWSTRSGRVDLDWVVIAAERPSLWIGLTNTSFIGPVVVHYSLEPVEGGTRFTRIVRNPQRPRAATEDQVRRIDEEATLGLANIKKNVEGR
ncbi:MAG: SRPBCC family protein [Proteobacteria bacterium]|nr:SRPBCC family protein [Pseudomonadota bacterium]